MSTPREEWVTAVTAARDAGASFFDLLTAVDLEDSGIEVLVHLWDPVAREHHLLRTVCPQGDLRVPSLLPVFAGAGWHERAVADLFGVRFDGHETAPLLLPESFEGHPLRKDFVLAARAAKDWPGVKEPGESGADVATARPRRRAQPLGARPDWGPP